MIINGRDTRKNSLSNTNTKDLSYYRSLIPQKTTQEKTDNLWVESTAPNVLENKNVDVKPVNIKDFISDVKTNTKDRQNKIEQDILKAGYKSEDFTDEEKKMLLSGEYSINPTYTPESKYAKKIVYSGKWITPKDIEELNEKAPLSQKIDKAIKYDIPTAIKKTGNTVMDLGANVVTGATNAFEGMADAAVGNLGAVASGVTSGFGLAPNSLSEKIKKGAEDFVRFNFSAEDILEEKKNEGAGIYEPKILGIKVRDALNAISNMVTSAVGGPTTFMASAAGQNIEEALLDNQSLNRAVVYGDVAGAIEGLTEKMFDAVKLLGGGKFDKFLPKGAIGKLVGGAAGEAIEEVIAEGINPFLKYMIYEKGTYDMPSLVEYLNTLKESAWNGFVIGLIMKGGQDVTSPQIREQYKEEIYTAVDKSKLPDNIKETVKEVMTTPAQAQINQDLQNYRNNSEFSRYVARDTVDNKIPSYPQIKGLEMIKKPSKTLALPEGGKIYVNQEGVAIDSSNYVAPREKFTPNNNYNIVNGKQVLIDPQNQTQNQEINKSNTITPTRAEMAQNANMEQITQAPNLPTQKAQKTLQSAKIAGMTDVDMQKAIDLNKMLRSGANLEFYDEKTIPQGLNNEQQERAKEANGLFYNNTLWINKNSERPVQKILGHELTHYGETQDFIKGILDSNLFYDFINEEGFANVSEYKKYLKEKKGYKDNELDSEMAAHFAEEVLFGNEKSINRLARENSTLTQKILNWLSDLRIKLVGTSQEKELLKIENMYRKALDQATNNSSSNTADIKYYIKKLAEFDETEYNNIQEMKLSPKEYGKLAHIVDTDPSIKPGVNQVETSDATYVIYQKEYNDFKVVDKYEGGVENDATANGNVRGTSETGDGREKLQVAVESIPNQRTAKGNDELLDGNQRARSLNVESNNDGISDKKNVAGKEPAFSMPEKDNQGRTLSKEQQEFFKDSKVRDVEGNLKPVYHGTKRADRVGYYFDPAKATSGPMAFFTDDVEIATNYSKSKQDTSISREADTEYDLFKVNGKDLDSYWDSLSPKQKRDIAEKGNNIGFDEDWENVVYGENASEESFGDQYKWRLNREYNGNAIKALYGIWIEDGNLMFEDIAKFKDILNMAGIENVEYLDKFKEEPKVYEVYMNLKNPFVTSDINQEIINKLQKASENATIGEQYTADSWDKSNIEPKDWMSMLRDDIKDNTTHSWTIIPDWVTDVLKSEGYDGIQDTGGKYSGLQHNVYIPFYSNQIKETSNTNPTENPDIRYSVNPTGTKKIAKVQALSKYAQTLQNKHEDIPEQINLIQKEIDNGNFTHEVIHDKRSLNYAQKYIEDNGFDDAVKHWDELIKRGKPVDKDELALGQMIYNVAVDNKDTRLVMKMASDLVQEYTEIGRNLQSATLLRKMTPDGKLYALERSVQKINQDLMQKFDNFENIKIPEELADKLLRSETQKDMDTAVEQIQEYIASKIPATWQEKLNSWRYLAMLGNPRTHIRNIVGNAVFIPAVEMKNALAQVGELTISKDQRTKSFVTSFNKKDAKLLKYAENDFDNNRKTIRGENKYDIRTGVQEKRTIYSLKALEAARKGNFNLLEAEDTLFLKYRYKKAFAGALKARGITIEQLRENTPETVRKVNEIRNYAINEAQKATYRDASKVAAMVSSGKRKLLNAANQSTGAAKLGYNLAYLGAEGVMPFAKTPINIVKRGIEYSPAGLLNGIKNAVFDVKSGKVTAAQAIDKIAAGATGTAIAGLGFFLASIGLVSGGEEEKDKEQTLKQLKGYQDYSLNVLGKSYTIDWTAPSSIPLFIGVELYNSITSEDESAYLNALGNLTEPVVEMSMLQGLNDTLTTLGQDSAIGNIVGKTLMNYLGQYNPTLFGQIARSVDPVRRTTYVDKNIPVPAAAQRFIQQQAAKIPGVSRMLPTYKDQFGQEQITDGVINRIVQNFFSPGYLKDIKEGTVEQGLTELYEKTGETSVIPSYASKTLTQGGKKINLTAKQYDTYAKTRGDISKKGLEGLFKDSYYKNLTDEQKVKIVEAIYDYANNVAKTKVLDDFELEFNDKKIQKLQNEGLDFYKYMLLKKTADYDGNGYTSNDELDKAIKKYRLTRWQKTIKEKNTKNTKTTNTLPTLKQQRAKLPTMK